MEPTEPTIVRQFAALLDSRFDALRGEIRADAREDTNSVSEEMRAGANSLREEMRASANSLREEMRASANSLREVRRESAASIRKEMRILAVGGAGLMVAGLLHLNTRITDLSVALARVEADLALLIERIPIQ